jgi:hypothetical protein
MRQLKNEHEDDCAFLLEQSIHGNDDQLLEALISRNIDVNLRLTDGSALEAAIQNTCRPSAILQLLRAKASCVFSPVFWWQLACPGHTDPRAAGRRILGA